MENLTILKDLAVVLLVSGLAAFVFHTLHQPKVVGYVIAGLIIGPHTPPFAFISDEATIRTLANLGIVFLMFSLGLEFNLRRILRVGLPAIVTAVLDVTVMVWLGYKLGRWLGWSPVESLFLGGIVCDSSTTVLARMLQELGRAKEKYATLLVGITIVEDLLAVVLVALLNGVAVTGTLGSNGVGVQLGLMAVFLITIVVGGLLTLPKLVNYVGRSRSEELIVVVILGICFGVSLAAARLKLSVALGAVLVGAILSEAKDRERLTALVEPFRHLFGAVFFVSIGLMLNPAVAVQHWIPILAVTVLVMVGKFVNGTVGSLSMGSDPATAVRTGAGLAQICEFAFIIAALGVTTGATRDVVYSVGVTVAVITTLLSPFFMRGMDRVSDGLLVTGVGKRWLAWSDLYGQWITRLWSRPVAGPVRLAVRRSFVVIGVNLAILAALFVAGGVVGSQYPGLAARLSVPRTVFTTCLWLACVLAGLPLYIATIRKVDALAMVFAEISIPIGITGTWAGPLRLFLSRILLLVGCAGVWLFTVILSSTLMPPVRVLAILVPLILVLAWWMWWKLVRIYARAQSSLISMLGEHGPGAGETQGGSGNTSSGTAPGLFNMEFKPVVIPEGGWVVGRSMKNMQLRRRTGATVVGIERSGQQMANPDPAIPFEAGDQVFVVGDSDQVAAAHAMFRRGRDDRTPAEAKP